MKRQKGIEHRAWGIGHRAWGIGLLFSLLSALCSVPVFAETNPYIAGCNYGSSCNPASEDVGDRAEWTGAVNGSNDDAKCLLAAASCSGTLGYGYAWHEAGSGTDSAKVCVYLASTRALVACSGTISSSADGAWVQTPGKLGGSVTASTNYYVCVVSDESIWTHGIYTSGNATVETVLEVGYDSPVDPLPAADSTDTSANLSAYVEIE